MHSHELLLVIYFGHIFVYRWHKKTHLTLCKRYVTHFFRVCSFHLESLLDNLVHEVCNMWYWPLGWRCQAQVTSGGTPSNIIVIYITKKYV